MLADPPRLRLPLIGRTTELHDATVLLRRPEVGLLTLNGPGGAGKTRLALELATTLRADFADGVLFVPLVAVRDPELVATTVASTLHIPETPDRTPAEALVTYLRERQLLLLLDNFEQVLAAAPLVAGLVEHCTALKVIVTSRAALRVTGEQEYPVPPLALPERDREHSVESLTSCASVELFCQRAAAVRPDFRLTPENAGAVAEICARLDGLPLAIELAAARIRVLPPAAIRTRLEHRLALLTDGARDVPERHTSLRHAIAWSYDLLPPPEQTLFARLAVFEGGCTLDDAASVCNHDDDLGIDTLDGLTRLVESHLLEEQGGPDGQPRFAMLETIREYARERLGSSGEADHLGQRHAAYFLVLVEHAAPLLIASEWEAWLRRLDAERDNIRAALGWAVEQAAVDVGLRLVGALYEPWDLHETLDEAQMWSARVLALPGAEQRTGARARALLTAGRVAWKSREYRAAATAFKEAIAIAREVGDERTLAHALVRLGSTYRATSPATAELLAEADALARRIGAGSYLAQALRWAGYHAINRGEPAVARPLLEEGQSVARRSGSPGPLAETTWDLAGLALGEREYDQARAYFNEVRPLAHESDQLDILSSVLCGLAYLALIEGDLAGALPLLVEGIAHGQTREYLPSIVENIDALARLAALRGDTTSAARLLAATAVQGVSESLVPAHAVLADETRAMVRDVLGDEAFAAAWAEGQVLSQAQVIAEALALAEELASSRVTAHPADGPSDIDSLTAREREVLRLLAAGKSNADIADELVLSIRTVERHISTIYSKLDAHGGAARAVAVNYALTHHLVDT